MSTQTQRGRHGVHNAGVAAVVTCLSLALAVASCATEPNPQTIPKQSQTVPTIEGLEDFGTWKFDAVPKDARIALTSDEAIESARVSGLRGEAFEQSQVPPMIAVPVMLNIEPGGEAETDSGGVGTATGGRSETGNPFAVTDKLAYVVQAENVELQHSVPIGMTASGRTFSTVQWAIDANSGDCLKVRSRGQMLP